MIQTPDFHDEMDRLQGHLPQWAARNLHKLRQPQAVWVRVPAGIALTGGGILSFLPVLGIWMLPLGLGLLAVDLPAMQGPLARALEFTNRKIEQTTGRKSRAGPTRRDREAAN